MGLQNWLHQYDFAVLRQTLFHLQNGYFNLRVSQVTEAEYANYGIVIVAQPLEVLQVLDVLEDRMFILVR